MGRNYWMVVSPPEDFEVTKERGFGVFGVRAKYRRRSQRMQPDDRMLFYVSGIRKWAATATVVSGSFEDRTPIWKPNRKSEVFPYRVKLKPTMVLNEDDYIDALWLAPSLEYVKRWAPEDWPLAFFDTLHLLPQKDFKLIEGEMVRLTIRNNSYRKSSGLTAPSGWSSQRAEDRRRAEQEWVKPETNGQDEPEPQHEPDLEEQHAWTESVEAQSVDSEADAFVFSAGIL